MLWNTIKRKRIDTVFVADVELDDAGAPAQSDAPFDAPARLHAAGGGRVHPEKLAVRLSERAEPAGNRMPDEDVRFTEPHVVDEGMLHGPASFEIDVDRRLRHQDPAERAGPELIPRNRFALG